MKRISHLVVVAALAFGAQAAWSNDEVSTESESMTVAAVGSTYGQEAGATESWKAKAESTLEKLGFIGYDGFPSRGGPIDD